MDAATLRDYATDAIKFWERQRIMYNLALTAVVILHFVLAYPASRTVLSLDYFLQLFLLAVAANVVYCSAYLTDVFAQASTFREIWQNYRWLLFAIGTTSAVIVTHFISESMFRPGH